MPTDKVDDLFEFSKKIEIDSSIIIFTLQSVTRAYQAKKLLLEKDTNDYVQINIADITK